MTKAMKLDIVRQVKSQGAVNMRLATSGDASTTLCAGESGTIEVLDTSSGASVGHLRGHKSDITSLALSSDGRLGASGDSSGEIRTWDIGALSCRTLLGRHRRRVSDLAIDAATSRLISSSWDNTLAVWDLNEGGRTRSLEGHTEHVTAVALSRDGALAFSTGFDRSIRIWELAGGTCVQKVDLSPHTDKLGAIAVNGAANAVFVGGLSGDLWVWRPQAEEVERFAGVHDSGISDVAVTGDGRLALVTGGQTLKLLEITSGTLLGHANFSGGLSIPGLGISMPVRLTSDETGLVCGRSGLVAVVNLSAVSASDASPLESDSSPSDVRSPETGASSEHKRPWWRIW